MELEAQEWGSNGESNAITQIWARILFPSHEEWNISLYKLNKTFYFSNKWIFSWRFSLPLGKYFVEEM
jgi:hypothetical protein